MRLNFHAICFPLARLLKDLNHVVNFTQSACVFQDLTLGRRIGSPKEHGGLYHFEDTSAIEQVQVQASICKSSLSRKQEIMLWHCSLGHPSFPHLRYLFPSLFQNNESFQCDIFQLTKHQRTFLPSQAYQASKPFALMHSDVGSISSSKYYK